MKSDEPKPAPERATPRVLVVDDQLALAETLADGLSERGYDAVAASSSREAARALGSDDFDVLVTDLRMPEPDGLALLAASKDANPARPVIMMTAYSAVDSAIESIRRGAYHYLTKPFKVDELALFVDRAMDEARLRRETVSLRRALKKQFAVREFVAESEAMREVSDLVERVANTTVPVLVLGETGTGKGLVARALHSRSSRAGAPFVTVNCTTLPEPLLESELFGHVKGSFTGATANRAGLFEEANGGTLFLDEIGDLPLSLQAKLLDVLERSVVRAVGANKERAVDVRIVAATHRELAARVAAGQFREDLLYRLDVVTIPLPPVRHRRDDIPGLIEHFLREARARHPAALTARISPEAMAHLVNHGWPGNVRELEHFVERAVLLGKKPVLEVADLPASMTAARDTANDFGSVVLPLREMQRRYVAWAYERLGSRKLLTAERLGIDDKTLVRWLSREPDEP
ncbi:MAG TPA: sigma-54 dependent transcriptional regulator [Polyangiaceae bacterium]|jgi:two-component system response regulator HydG|nr:sigma-54 dependent transcriptional regulator [Polyangiaceae bacterium]